MTSSRFGIFWSSAVRYRISHLSALILLSSGAKFAMITTWGVVNTFIFDSYFVLNTTPFFTDSITS